MKYCIYFSCYPIRCSNHFHLSQTYCAVTHQTSVTSKHTQCIFGGANMGVCIYSTTKIKPDLGEEKKKWIVQPDHHCVIFLFRTDISMVQFSDHLSPLNARINGKLSLFLCTTLLEKPFCNECWTLLSPIYGFNSSALMKKSDTLYVPTSGVHLEDILLMWERVKLISAEDEKVVKGSNCMWIMKWLVLSQIFTARVFCLFLLMAFPAFHIAQILMSKLLCVSTARGNEEDLITFQWEESQT